MPLTSDDEYAAYDLLAFTEDDFKQIDAHVALNIGAQPLVESSQPLDVSQPQSEQENAPSRNASHKSPSRSNSNSTPSSRFRRHRWLSVTDISSLSWCEVQVEYGLRQRRFRPISERPPSFVSAQGKEIQVSKTVAAANDKRQKQGKNVHKRLEREIKVEDVHVDISSKEEMWALRLVNLMDGFQCIFREGYTREIPVFGVYKDVIIIGAIDEIRIRRRSEPQKSEHEQPGRPPSSTGARITDVFPRSLRNQKSDFAVGEMEVTSSVSASKKVTGSCLSDLDTLHLIDTKTRNARSFPSFEDSRPSRIQLMLYYRLFKDLISTSPVFDFKSLWNQQGVDPSAPFSREFLIQSTLVAEDDERMKLCLNDLVETWTKMIHMHDKCKVDSELQLIYRQLDKKSKDKTSKDKKEVKRRARRKGQFSDSMALPVTQDEIDLSMAIEASLRNVTHRGEGVASFDARAQIGDQVGPTLAISTEESLMNRRHSEREDSDLSSNETGISTHLNTEDESAARDITIIGTTTFEYDEEMISRHLEYALEWWYGRKEPQGVSIENSHRCYSCEYRSHCEWREKKVLELEELRNKKMSMSHDC